MNNRLSLVYKYINPCDVIADIGTDHGNIPVKVIKNDIAKFVYACDINEGPLSRAKENIENNNMSDRIETVLSNGLVGLLDKERRINGIIISGMGGELIIDIIENGLRIAKEASFMVLQPQTRSYKLRDYLYNNGFYIDDDELVRDSHKTYEVMRVIYDGKQKKIDSVEKYLGKNLLKSKNNLSISYSKRALNRFLTIYENSTDVVKKEEAKKVINFLKEYLNV
jgi:tRNA (adenine22-N1)-methyltransferase